MMFAGAAEIGAGAADRAHPIGQHAALGVEREFAGRCQIAAMGAADELVGAVAAPAHLAPELDRGIGHDAVFRIEAGLLAEAAADIADQHANAFLRPLQHGFRQQVAGRARRLRLHMQDQPPGFLLDLGDGRARLHRGGDQPLADQIERDDMRGAGERRFDLGGIAIAHDGRRCCRALRPIPRARRAWSPRTDRPPTAAPRIRPRSPRPRSAPQPATSPPRRRPVRRQSARVHAPTAGAAAPSSASRPAA